MTERILFIDDDPLALAAYKRQLHGEFEIETAVGGDEGLHAITEKGPYAVIVCDLRMPDIDGIQVLSQAKKLAPDSIRVILTGRTDLESAIAAVHEGHIFRFLTKPCSLETLTQTLRDALEQYRLITERQRAQEELRKAKEEAEAASRIKSEFLVNISHEIRTPLNAIMGMSDLIFETELTGEQRCYLRVIRSSSEALLSLINDILDFSKIESGRMEIAHKVFDLHQVVESVAEVLSFQADRKGLELVCFVDPGLPNLVVGDAERLRQILINLVGNAIKFTAAGEVMVRVKAAENFWHRHQNDEVMALHFMVSDTGIGISRDQQARIFEKFTQVDNSTTRKFGGAGLGLTISKSLVELMGGRMWLDSALNKGSTFHFKLDLPVADRSPAPKQESGQFNSKRFRVLVVDDNDTCRSILKSNLAFWGFLVKEATNGREALDLLKSNGSKFDVILLDQQMPGLNGFDVARIIRKDSRAKDSKIVLLSSWKAANGTIQQELRIDQVITKPVTATRLFCLLQDLFPGQVPTGVLASAPKTGCRDFGFGRSVRILLVEDNIDNQRLTRKLLEKVGYSVDVAGNGRLAVESFRRFQYDLILMDVQMPVMDGFSATQEIRAFEQETGQGRVPIIAFTAHAIHGYRERCLQYGMDDYITKPINRQRLLDAVSRWLH